MHQWEKTLRHILLGGNDKSIRFDDAVSLLISLGFKQRIKGDHYIFTKSGVNEILNIQPNKSMTKAYQVKQIRDIIIKYNLSGVMNDV